jgi:Zn finger protein HypA/HybF involved in hydrogenase expression
MRMSPTLAYNCKTLEADPTPVESLTVECARCDPDNPLAVPRAKCPECKGTGKASIALAAIVTEIRASRLELLRGGQDDKTFYDY